MENKIVWALFDDGVGSWTKKNIDGFEIHSIGIKDKDWKNYHKIDLSITNCDLIKQLNKLPKPDIILASPPCESWSWADGVGQMQKEINDNQWVIKNKNYYDNHNRSFINKEKQRILGHATASGLIHIINTFWWSVFNCI